MSRTPQRERKAPERFGHFASKRAAEELELDEEQVLRRRQRRRLQESGSEGAEEQKSDDEFDWIQDTDGSKDDEGSEGETEAEQRHGATVRARGANRPRRAAERAYVPQPAVEPRSRGDMLSLFFACPKLIDTLLEADGLRTISLVARDAASLAGALCARTADVTGLWHQLARRCDPAFAAGGTTAEALAVVQRACKADPVRGQRTYRLYAIKDYRLTEKDLRGLSTQAKPSRGLWESFNVLDVLVIAHHKHGSAAGLQAAQAAAKAKSERVKAANAEHRQCEEQRREEISGALEGAGLEGTEFWRHRANEPLQAFIKRGTGSIADIVAALKQQGEAARSRAQQRAQRSHRLQLRLDQEGLGSDTHWEAAQAYINGTSRQALEAVVGEVKAAHEAAGVQQQRRERVSGMLAAAGLQRYAGSCGSPSLKSAYVERGEGSVEAALSALQPATQRLAGHAQRSARMGGLLAAEGLQEQLHVPAVREYVNSGAVGEEVALEAARQAHRARQERRQREAHMVQLLAAEGLQEHMDVPAVRQYIKGGAVGEEAALAAARVRQGQPQREAHMFQLLAAQGISPYEFLWLFEDVWGLDAYMLQGRGDPEKLAVKARARCVAYGWAVAPAGNAV